MLLSKLNKVIWKKIINHFQLWMVNGLTGHHILNVIWILFKVSWDGCYDARSFDVWTRSTRSTRKQYAKHLFAGQNAQHTLWPTFWWKLLGMCPVGCSKATNLNWLIFRTGHEKLCSPVLKFSMQTPSLSMHGCTSHSSWGNGLGLTDSLLWAKKRRKYYSSHVSF